MALFLAAVVGIFKPALVVKWRQKAGSRLEAFAVYFILAYLAGFIATNLADTPQQPPPHQNQTHEVYASKKINVSFDISVYGNRKPAIAGKTNLPNKTEFIVTLERDNGNHYRAQDECSVNDGKFKAGPFTNHGNPISPGKYIVKIDSPTNSLQPNSVQNAFGDMGKNLQGEHVEAHKIMGKTIDYMKTIEVS